MKRYFVLVVLSSMMSLAVSASAQWKLVWSDEFNGAAGAPPNSTNWVYEQGNNSGWGNGEVEYYCAPGGSGQQYCNYGNPNIHQDGSGNLVIQARQESTGKWTSGRMKTFQLQEFTYGRIEARMQLPNNCVANGILCTGLQGIWPAFWMMGDNGITWPGNGELDIMEQIGKQPTIVNGTLHGTGYSSGIGLPYNSPDSSYFGSNFHIYGMIWSASEVQFYVDDPSNIYATYTADEITTAGGNATYPGQWDFINHPFYMILNVAVGGSSSWGGATDATTLNPQNLLVDYVRVYQWNDKPTTPNLNLTPVSNSQIRLTWTASSSEDANITYNVFRSGQAGTTNSTANWITTQVASTTFTDTMLTPGANYCYVVSASGVNAPESALSNEMCTTTGSGTNIQPIAISTGSSLGSGNWVRDTGYSGTTAQDTNVVNANQAVDMSGVLYPGTQGVYRTERWSPVVYTIPNLTAGTNYLVRIHFMEAAQSAVGKRFFNVSTVNTSNSAITPLLTQFDIFATAGAEFKAVAQQFTLPADPNGTIQLSFTKGSGGSSQNPSVRGIEVIPIPAASQDLSATSTNMGINLIWGGASSACPVTYNIYRGTGTGVTPSNGTLVGSALSSPGYSDATVILNTQYFYVVQVTGCRGAAAISNEATAIYVTAPAATPAFSVPAGTYSTSQVVAFSDTSAGVTIYYTTDGSTPSPGSAVYSGPITVLSTETIKAIASGNGYSVSAAAGATYTIRSPGAIPSFTVMPGIYPGTQIVTLSDSTAGTIILYTTDGSTPTASSSLYSAPITVSSTETIMAIASGNGYSDSVPVSFTVQNMDLFIARSDGSMSWSYNTGALQGGPTSGGGIGVAVDANGYVWSIGTNAATLSKFTDMNFLSATYGSIGLSGASALGIDGNGQIWVANSNHTVSAISNSGIPSLTIAGSSSNTPSGLAIDISGNVWIANSTSNNVDEIVGAAAPVAPLAIGVTNNTLGVEP